MGSRWYDAQLGRWISPDPIIPDPATPQSFNRYSWVLGNPLRYLDPTGHDDIISWFIETGKKIGNSGPIGKALVVGVSEAVNHVNRQTQKVFYPDENADPVDRFWACIEVGGGAVVFAATATEVVAGTLTTAAAAGGVAGVTATTGTAAILSADGDPTNEAQSLSSILETSWTVIGKYPAYLDKAKQLGAKVLDIPSEEWSGLGSRAAQWARNVQFLDEAIARGDSFRLATSFAAGWAEKGTFYKDELIYLLQQGYELVIANGQEWLVKLQ